MNGYPENIVLNKPGTFRTRLEHKTLRVAVWWIFVSLFYKKNQGHDLMKS